MQIQKNIQGSVLLHSIKSIDEQPPSETITNFNWFARFENNEQRTMKLHAQHGLTLVENK